jgi:phospholipase C
MSFFRVSAMGVTSAGLVALSIGLNGCGGGHSSPPPTPSYSLTATALNPASITAGNTSTSTITLTPANGYSGNVTLSCAAIAGANAPSCSFSGNPVQVSGDVSSTLTISTTASTPGGSYAVSVTGKDTNNLAPSNGPQPLTLTTAAVIQHVVVIFQENRTPDNLFQDSVLIAEGADIAQQGTNSSGQTITLAPIDLGTSGSNPQNYDLSHAHTAFVSMYDGGKMDGADKIACSPAAQCPPNAHPNPQFKYVMQSDVAPYFAMAEQYTFGDRMFQTNEGPSFPAHQFIYGGTSAPTATSPLFASENPNEPAGCIAAATTTVTVIDAAGSESAQPPQYPCFEHQTLSDLLDAKSVTWRYYAPSAGSIWTAPDAIQHICQPQTVSGTLTCTGPAWSGSVVIPESQVLTDIANGQLAQVSWVIPDGAASDHALSNNGSGPSWVAGIVNAIGNGPYWANTAIIITWDDWGGWYDHVPPVFQTGANQDDYQLGFRVPLLVVSAYSTKVGYISNLQYDFGSILKAMEGIFKLGSLGFADARAANDLRDFFNFNQPASTYKTIPAPLEGSFFTKTLGTEVDPPDSD